MVSFSACKWIVFGLVGALAPVAFALGQEAAPAGERQAAPPIALPVEITLQAKSPEGQTEDVIALIGDALQGAAAQAQEAQVQETPPSEYYIGIALGELPELVKTQLKLEHGLVVEDVLPDSPAAKAEFKRQDILIRAGDAKLAAPADILKAVDEAKDKEMRIVIVRDGQEMAVQVRPTKRPKPESADEGQGATAEGQYRLPASAIQRIEEALRELKGADGAAKSLELYFPRPGIVAQRVEAKTVELPKNMKISITREGDGPAKIHVEREGKSWDATDDKLGELPEDVRGQVERMLSKVIHPMLATRARALVVPRVAHAYSPGTPGAPGTPAVPAYPVAPGTSGTRSIAPPQAARVQSYRAIQSAPSGLEAKIDQILKKLNADDDNQTLDKLREEVDRLRKEVDALKNK
jgi:hypothetical protein